MSDEDEIERAWRKFQKLADQKPFETNAARICALGMALSQDSHKFVIMVDPADPDSTLVLWKGMPLGAIASIEFAQGQGVMRVSLRRFAWLRDYGATRESEEFWEELKKEGIHIEEIE